MAYISEKDLVKDLKSGKIKAFDSLYYKYHKKLFAYILSIIKNWHDSEDLMQKIFITIWDKRENIDPEKSFNNYIFRIARNEIFDLIKKKALTEYCYDYVLSNIPQKEEELDSKKIIEIMCSLIEKIPERRRQIFLMNRDMGLTYKQIAQQLGISENTVDTQIRNSLNYLRKELPKYIKSFTLILINIFK